MGLMKKYSQFLKELPSKTVVFAFGRFNPPTSGHELLVKAVKKLAASNKADHAIYASKSQDAKKNPLSVDKKVHYLDLMFPNTNFVAANPNERTFIEAAKSLNKKYKNLIMVAGSDRVPEYEKILTKYNGSEFHFDTVQVISAGERDPDSDDASGMSASKMRALATKGDYNGFKKGLPSTMRDIDGRRLMNDVRQGMGLDVVKEQINLVKDELREQYFRGEIFNIGDIVESAGVSYEIVKRGSNHLLLKEESGKLSSKWIQDVTPAQELKLEENMLSEDLTDKTLKSQDKIKVARVIATILGIDNAESSSNAEQLVNLGLRKAKSKTLNKDSLAILQKMLGLATEVGIEYDNNLVPSALKEAKGTPDDDAVVIKKSTDYNGAKDRLRYSDYTKLQKMNSHTPNEPGSSLEDKGDDDLRRMKVKEEVELSESHVEFRLDHRDKVKGDHKPTFADHEAKVSDTTDKATYVKVPAHKAESFKRTMKSKHGVTAELAEAAQPYWKKASWVKKMSQAAKQERLARERKEAEQKKQPVKEETITEGQTDDWKKVQSMDKGSVLQGKEGAKKRLDYLKAVHAHHKKYGNDVKKVKTEIERLNRSRLAEGLGRGREDDEYHTPDPVGRTHKIGFHVSKEGGEKHHRTVTISNSTKSHDEAKSAARAHLEKQGYKIHEDVSMELCGTCGQEPCVCPKEDEASLGANNAKGYDPMKEEAECQTVQGTEAPHVDMSEYEGNYEHNMSDDGEDFSDEDLDDMADDVDDIDDVMDVYDDEEFGIIDDETGEEIPHDESEQTVSEEALNEVLSRMERMKAKMRIRRTKAVRERKMKIALKTYSTNSKINDRSRRLAVKLIKKRLLRGRDASKISVGEKERIERIIQKRKATIGRLAMRLAPRVRKIEKARMSHTKYTKAAPQVAM